MPPPVWFGLVEARERMCSSQDLIFPLCRCIHEFELVERTRQVIFRAINAETVPLHAEVLQPEVRRGRVHMEPERSHHTSLHGGNLFLSAGLFSPLAKPVVGRQLNFLHLARH